MAVGDALVQAHLLGLNAVNPHFSTVDEEVVTRARDLRLDVNVWTVNSEEDLERMAALERGVHHHRRSVARASGRGAERPDGAASRMT